MMAASLYGVNQVTELYPNLYLTSIYGATKDNIMRRNATLLVNAAQELPKADIHGVESIKLFLDDTPHSLASVYFDRIADKINEHVTGGGCAFVHCVLGVSRSTTLCIAYLMKHKNMSLKQAYEYISSRRPCARPNPGFWRQLIEYEKRLNNIKSKLQYNLQLATSNSPLPSSSSSSSQPLTTQNSTTGQNTTNTLNINPVLFSKDAIKTFAPFTSNNMTNTGTYTTANGSVFSNLQFDDQFFSNHMTPTSKLYKSSNRFSITRSHTNSFSQPHNPNPPSISIPTNRHGSILNGKDGNSAVLSALTITPSFPTGNRMQTSGSGGGLLINNASQDMFIQPKQSAGISTTYRSSFGLPKY